MKVYKDRRNIEGSDCKKQFGAILNAWAFHDLFGAFKTAEQRQRFRELRPRCAPVFFTGQVQRDYLGRWGNGSCMQSSLIVTVTAELNGLRVETENTIYRLEGAGRVSTERPLAYDFEVGKTILLLESTNNIDIDAESFGHMVSPDQPESFGVLYRLIETINATSCA